MVRLVSIVWWNNGLRGYGFQVICFLLSCVVCGIDFSHVKTNKHFVHIEFNTALDAAIAGLCLFGPRHGQCFVSNDCGLCFGCIFCGEAVGTTHQDVVQF